MTGALKGRLLVAAIIIIIATAFLLTLPAAVGPVRVNDSYWIDWVWLDQFADALRNGQVYPRWLPLSHGGLGSPVFYYYPPLAFYLGSAFVLAGLAVYPALLATFFAGYVLSGAAMYFWLKGQARSPLLGALVYMIAPYHAANFYLRGALAEFLATAILPFVLLGLRRLQLGKGDGFAITALSFAALICSHLPLALLASLFLIGPYALVQGHHAPRQLLYAFASLGTGIALASAYLIAAVMLEPYRDSAKLWEHPVLQPENWTFWNNAAPEAYAGMLVIGAVLAIPLAILAIFQRSRWALFGLACVLLGIGLIPALWDLPIIRSVQFPFRIFPLAEFALATALAFVAWRPLLLTLVSLPLLVVTSSIVMMPPPSRGVPMDQLQTRHPDVPENLPPGERPYSWPSQWALAIAESHRQPQFSNGTTVEPVFYFPAWQVRCGDVVQPTFPDPRTQLLSYKGRNCARTLVRTAPETIGMVVSLLGLLLVTIVIAMARAGKRRLPATAAGSREQRLGGQGLAPE